MSPLVSIIIPAHNAAPWLAQSIASAQSQTWPSVEIIVVDDGSTDDTLAIARNYSAANLKVIASSNRGASAARNLGMAAARGEFFQFLDADDLLSPDKIAVQLNLLANEASSCLATSGLVFFNDDSPPEQGLDIDGLPHAGDSDSPLEFLLRLYGRGGTPGMIQTSQWLVPRCVAQAAGPWDESLTVDDDGEYFARIVEHSSGVRHAPRGRVYYRKHTRHGSLSATWRHSESRLSSGIRSLDGKRAVLARLGANTHELRTLAPFYCEWAMAAYPRYPALVHAALDGARHCGDLRAAPRMATPKGRRVQALVGWRLARRIQTWLQ